MKKIDLDTWPRKSLYEFFSNVSNPFYSATFTVDVTRVYDYTKSRGLSFYCALTYLVSKAVNRVPALLYTIRDGEIYLLDERIPSITDRNPGEEFFHITNLPCGESLDEFCVALAEKSRRQTDFILMEEESADLIYISCLPWIELTGFINERDFDRDDTIPRITWGKYKDENGRKTLGMALELNHRFADGSDIGAFATELEKHINEL